MLTSVFVSDQQCPNSQINDYILRMKVSGDSNVEPSASDPRDAVNEWQDRRIDEWPERKRAETYIKADCIVDREKDGRVKGLGAIIVSVFHLTLRAKCRKKFRYIFCLAIQSLGINGKCLYFLSLLLLCYTGWSKNLCAPDDYNTESYK
jgi:hypothetical protein